VKGKRTEKSLNKSINPNKWDTVKKRGKGNSEDIRILNELLVDVEHGILKAKKELVFKGECINLESLMNKYNGVEEKDYMLVDVFEHDNKRVKSLREEGTYKKYVTVLKHLKTYLMHQYKLTDISIRKVDYKFVIDFDYYLRTEKNLKNNSTIRVVKTLKKVVVDALHKGWIERDPFVSYKVKKEKVETKYLLKSEVEAIYKKEFTIKRLDYVRDVFIFCCYTGLAYIDVKLLVDDNIIRGIDGASWIKTNRKKTKTLSHIPVLPVAQEILNKYKDNPVMINSGRLLPVLSNQKVNAYLKEIGDVCGVKTELTSHIARHTFATTIALSNGLPVETLSKIMGHKSLNMTLHYAKLLDTKLSSDVANLKESLKDSIANPQENSNSKVV
jgi:integrase